MKKGIGGHQSAIMKSDEWLTPPELIQQLGPFDLDPCSPVHRPWPTAIQHYTILDNGLIQPWVGRVWLNPPYGRDMEQWLKKMADHCNGIALTFARTDTEAFHRYIFSHADSIFFIRQRLSFYTVAGTKAKHNGGAPSVLVAYGDENVEALEASKIQGKHVHLNSIQMVVVGVSPSWKSVVSIALTRLNGEATLKAIYDVVETIAPDKTHKNRFYKEKVRQIVQMHFNRRTKGVYTIDLTEKQAS